MKKYKIQNRSQKNSHSCLPLKKALYCVAGEQDAAGGEARE
jgi:hypothetical protein